mmetsp:Transcript_16267/g.26840  ORF Transcript_16267/g.26840 Transcript_16267/m.26840 type:complete len:122 (+) Transcript_16267:840-1205(+)
MWASVYAQLAFAKVRMLTQGRGSVTSVRVDFSLGSMLQLAQRVKLASTQLKLAVRRAQYAHLAMDVHLAPQTLCHATRASCNHQMGLRNAIAAPRGLTRMQRGRQLAMYVQQLRQHKAQGA